MGHATDNGRWQDDAGIKGFQVLHQIFERLHDRAMQETRIRSAKARHTMGNNSSGYME